jgi:hypothetical protein
MRDCAAFCNPRHRVPVSRIDGCQPVVFMMNDGNDARHRNSLDHRAPMI